MINKFKNIILKSRNKQNRITVILSIILFINFIFISSGYAILSQTLNLNGTVGVSNNGIELVEGYAITYNIKDTWYNNLRYYYNTNINIVNSSGYQTTGWEVSMDIPSDVTSVDAYKATYLISNERITFKNLGYNGIINSGSTLDFGFILNTGLINDFKPNNVVIKIYSIENPNGLIISFDDDDDDEEPVINDFDVTNNIVNSWYSNSRYYYNINMNILNNSNYTTKGWEVSMDIPSDVTTVNAYTTTYTISNGRITFKNLSYNREIPAGGTQDFGFSLNTGLISDFKPSNVVIKVYSNQNPNGISITIDETPLDDPDDNPDDDPDEEDDDTNNENPIPNFSPYLEVDFQLSSSWKEGEYTISQYNVSVENISTSNSVTSWGIEVDNINEFLIDNSWNVNYVLGSNVLALSNVSYNGDIKKGKNIKFGIVFKHLDENFVPNVSYTKATVQQ